MSELIGVELDAAAAQAAGFEHRVESWATNPPRPAACWLVVEGRVDFARGPFSPSTNRDQGDETIERFGIATWRCKEGWGAAMPGTSRYPGDNNYVDVNVDDDGAFGPTRLIAAVRAFVGSQA
jgi:hypothetical protein